MPDTAPAPGAVPTEQPASPTTPATAAIRAMRMISPDDMGAIIPHIGAVRHCRRACGMIDTVAGAGGTPNAVSRGRAAPAFSGGSPCSPSSSAPSWPPA
ncbi:Uncharacterised protein [Bordetella pertussis]|nr:Uncharacterised protein [Bordetella pertussis]